MQRRTVLIGGVGVLATTAGCTGILGDSDDGDPSGPAETGKAYWEAIFNLNADEANSYIHPDSDIEPVEEPPEDEEPQNEFSVQNVEVIEESENSATVQINISGDFTGSGETESTEMEYSLRKYEGEWLMVEITTDSNEFGGGGPSAPTTAWEMNEQTNSSGEVTTVTFQLTSVDEAVQAENLEIYAGDVTAQSPGNNQQLTAGSTIRVPFEQSGTSIEASTEVSLIWSSSDTRATLATYTLENSTAGSLADNFQVES